MIRRLVLAVSLGLTMCSRSPAETGVRRGEGAPAQTTPAQTVLPPAEELCPDGRPPVAAAPCPGEDLWEALHCPGRECAEGTVWDGQRCVPRCGAQDGGP